MKQFKTVMIFEYLNYVKSKTFIIITALFLALIIVLSSLPNLIGMFSSVFSPGGENTTETGETTEETGDTAGYFDPMDMYTPEILKEYAPGYTWEKLDSLDSVEDMISDGSYALAVSLDGLNVAVYQPGTSFVFSDTSAFSQMVVKTYQANALTDAGLSTQEIEEILNVTPAFSTIAIGRDLSQSYWLGYVLLFLLYITILMYGQYITMSVVTEKTSKAMELLISSAKPMSLMFGKVIGTGLAGLTQFVAIIVTALVSLRLNISAWQEFSPMVASLLDLTLSANLLVYTVVFFLLGFFSFAFIYAGMASTVSRVEDANGAQSIPMMLFIAAFLVAMLGGLATPDAFYVKVCSYVPFLSPLIMFMRICTVGVSGFQIALCIGANILYILGAGYISSKIYKVGVMLYGNKPKLGAIFRMIAKS